MILNNVLISGILISLAVATPHTRSGEANAKGGRSRRASFGERSSYSSVRAPLANNPAGPSPSSSSQDKLLHFGVTEQVDRALQSTATSGAPYTISNFTIHQYPKSAHVTSENQGEIGEDVSFWIADMNNNQPDFATEAFCHLTWTASTANPAGPPATGQMKCEIRNPNNTTVSQGLPNSSAHWNATFQQQTESPLPGFNLLISSSPNGPTDTVLWAPRNLSSDVAWQINENYFQYTGMTPLSKSLPSQGLKSRSSYAIPDDQIKVADLTNKTIANAAANDHGTAPDVSNDQIKVADLTNQNIADEAAGSNGSTPDLPNAQIQVADLTNKTIANEAAQGASTTRSGLNDEVQVANLENEATVREAANAPANVPISTASVPAATPGPAPDGQI